MKKKAEKHELANLKTLSKRNIQSERVKVSTKYLDAILLNSIISAISIIKGIYNKDQLSYILSQISIIVFTLMAQMVKKNFEYLKEFMVLIVVSCQIYLLTTKELLLQDESSSMYFGGSLTGILVICIINNEQLKKNLKLSFLIGCIIIQGVAFGSLAILEYVTNSILMITFYGMIILREKTINKQRQLTRGKKWPLNQLQKIRFQIDKNLETTLNFELEEARNFFGINYEEKQTIRDLFQNLKLSRPTPEADSFLEVLSDSCQKQELKKKGGDFEEKFTILELQGNLQNTHFLCYWTVLQHVQVQFYNISNLWSEFKELHEISKHNLSEGLGLVKEYRAFLQNSNFNENSSKSYLNTKQREKQQENLSTIVQIEQKIFHLALDALIDFDDMKKRVSIPLQRVEFSLKEFAKQIQSVANRILFDGSPNGEVICQIDQKVINQFLFTDSNKFLQLYVMLFQYIRYFGQTRKLTIWLDGSTEDDVLDIKSHDQGVSTTQNSRQNNAYHLECRLDYEFSLRNNLSKEFSIRKTMSTKGDLEQKDTINSQKITLKKGFIENREQRFKDSLPYILSKNLISILNGSKKLKHVSNDLPNIIHSTCLDGGSISFLLLNSVQIGSTQSVEKSHIRINNEDSFNNKDIEIQNVGNQRKNSRFTKGIESNGLVTHDNDFSKELFEDPNTADIDIDDLNMSLKLRSLGKGNIEIQKDNKSVRQSILQEEGDQGKKLDVDSIGDKKNGDSKAKESINLQKQRQKSSSSKNAGGKNILLVDKNEFNLYIASNFLQEMGMNVEVCSHIQDCLDYLQLNKNEEQKERDKEKNRKYDIIICDMEMPKIRNQEFAVYLVNQLKNTIPVMIMDTDLDQERKAQLLKDGVFHYISKPLNDKELTKIFNQLWEP